MDEINFDEILVPDSTIEGSIDRMIAAAAATSPVLFSLPPADMNNSDDADATSAKRAVLRLIVGASKLSLSQEFVLLVFEDGRELSRRVYNLCRIKAIRNLEVVHRVHELFCAGKKIEDEGGSKVCDFVRCEADFVDELHLLQHG
ncbi:hypothetical protein HDU77_011662 [Chytriomyces hyalinus]|nr:hypothetical protein HDU77_011662 [Chytriomyces hyalinus]